MTNKVFLFWHERYEKMPLFHKMNVDNFRRRLRSSRWEILLTNLDEKSDSYIGHFIDLPEYFYDIENRISDIRGLRGNQSDIIRLRLLEKYGGCYFDTSTIFLRYSIDELYLYNQLLNSDATLAGYSNVTFTRKNDKGENYFTNAIDGIELGAILAKNNSDFLYQLNREIDNYWKWKTKYKIYTDYPPFLSCGLTKTSFLNEYHIHYSIYQMLLTKDDLYHNSIITQSIHMKDKEGAIFDGPYSVQDRFCRGATGYGAATPEALLQVFKEKIISSNEGRSFDFHSRVQLFLDTEFLIFPGYLRRDLEKSYITEEDYRRCPIFKYFYEL